MTNARPPRFDLLAWPVIGRFLRWRHARTAMQAPVFLLAALMIFDGLVGPQLAPKNLATVGVWLHYRGLVVLALLVAGNLFCMACPFMLPRQAGRWLRERFWGGGRSAPRALRNKWLAVALIVAFFFCYEYFSLWASPWLTAWVAIGYFLAAFTVDTFFQGAAFCKYICPLGQFNFFGSLISPLEITVRAPSTCVTCRTKDCISAPRNMKTERSTLSGGPQPVVEGRGAVYGAQPPPSTTPVIVPTGSAQDAQVLFPKQLLMPSVAPRPMKSRLSGFEALAGRVVDARNRLKPRILNGGQLFSSHGAAVASSGLRGCELWLFQPRKVGNMDCTFCLDCIHACPHDNIGLLARTPTAELWTDPYRSGIGRFSGRADLAALVVVFTFGAFLNAFAMIRPVHALQARLAGWLGTTSRAPGLALIFLIGLVLLPAISLALAGSVGRALGRDRRARLRDVVQRYIYALAPLGFGMWLAHYSFHFLIGGLTVAPVAQSFLADVGLFGGKVQWGLGALVPFPWLFPIEAIMLYLGATGAIVTCFQIARQQAVARGDGDARGAILGASLPWMALIVLLLAFGLWIMLQPMEMRGTMQMALPVGG